MTFEELQCLMADQVKGLSPPTQWAYIAQQQALSRYCLKEAPNQKPQPEPDKRLLLIEEP